MLKPVKFLPYITFHTHQERILESQTNYACTYYISLPKYLHRNNDQCVKQESTDLKTIVVYSFGTNWWLEPTNEQHVKVNWQSENLGCWKIFINKLKIGIIQIGPGESKYNTFVYPLSIFCGVGGQWAVEAGKQVEHKYF